MTDRLGENVDQSLFQQEPYEISRQYAKICAFMALLVIVLSYTGRPEMAADFAAIVFGVMAFSFYTVAGPTVIGWREVDDLE